jgi:hypothetical protein
VEQQQHEGSIEEHEGVRTMMAKPKPNVVVCTVALALVIATGWAVQDALAAAEVGAPETRDWLLQGGRTQNKDGPILRRQHAANWILNAQKATPNGGVSAWYNLSTG